MRIIGENHEEIVSGLIKVLEGRPLALSTDCGVRKVKIFFSLSCHVITNNEYQTMHLGLVERKEICTGEYIVTKIEELLTEYKVGIKDIISITWDYGSNMIKACEIIRQQKEHNGEELVTDDVNNLANSQGETINYLLDGIESDFQDDGNISNYTDQFNVFINSNSDFNLFDDMDDEMVTSTISSNFFTLDVVCIHYNLQSTMF